MGQFIVESAHLNTDRKKFGENYDHIFNREKCECVECLVKKAEKKEAEQNAKIAQDSNV